MKKRIIFLFFLFLFPIFTSALAIRSDSYYVTDEAGILSFDSKEYIVQYSTFLEENNHIEYDVITVSSLENLDFDSYVDYLYQSFPISDNSLLILFVKDQQKIQVVAGGELSEVITSDIIQESLDLYFIPYFKNYEWDKGIMNGYKAFYKMICNYYDIDSSTMEVYDGKDFFMKYRLYILIGITIISTIFGFVLSSFFKYAFKGKKISIGLYFLFTIGIFFNIVMFIFIYSINPYYVLIVLSFELASIMKSFNTQPDMTLEEAMTKVRVEEYKKERKKKKSKKTM